MSKLIQPRTLKGFRDHVPASMIPRERLIDTAREVYRSFGFAPIDTPALEYTEVLLGKGGDETDKQMYRFSDHGGRDVALRFDLTIPFARFAAQNVPSLGTPFKRYHVGPVWRGENTQRGRYREFVQCDFDTIGTESPLADVETLLVIHELFQRLEVGPFTIHVNDRKILTGLLERLELVDQAVPLLRALDKLDKIGPEKVSAEMQAEAGVSAAAAEEVLALARAAVDPSGPHPEARGGLDVVGEGVAHVHGLLGGHAERVQGCAVDLGVGLGDAELLGDEHGPRVEVGEESQPHDLVRLLGRQAVGDDPDHQASLAEGLEEGHGVLEGHEVAEGGVVVCRDPGSDDQRRVGTRLRSERQPHEELVEVVRVVGAELPDHLHELPVDLLLVHLEPGLDHRADRVPASLGGERGGGEERVVEVEEDGAEGGHGVLGAGLRSRSGGLGEERDAGGGPERLGSCLRVRVRRGPWGGGGAEACGLGRLGFSNERGPAS